MIGTGSAPKESRLATPILNKEMWLSLPCSKEKVFFCGL
jgi:hypothetical protein